MEREPYFTEEERKQPWVREEDYFRFETKRDLSGGVDVYPLNYGNLVLNESYLVRDVASFMANFMLWHYPRLNGFSGTDCIQWRIHS